MSKKRALILGVTGQDGSYLAEVLIERGYDIHGVHRRSSTGNLRNLQHIPPGSLTLHKGDLADTLSIERIIRKVEPHEIYNEADQDNVDWSRFVPWYNMDITAGAVGRLLEIVKDYDKTIRVFQPLSAMMFGNAPAPQTEHSPFNPMSPYAVAKVAAYYLCRYYREAFGMFVSTAIMYNHDSVRRSEEYLLHKICASVIRIYRKEQETLALGNLEAQVDIGWAKEYVEAAHSILQLDKPNDFVLSTEQRFSIGELVEEAFGKARLEPRIQVDPAFNRPGPVPNLLGYCGKAREAFGWNPKQHAKSMVDKLFHYYASLRSSELAAGRLR